jgi:hypothetical protein
VARRRNHKARTARTTPCQSSDLTRSTTPRNASTRRLAVTKAENNYDYTGQDPINNYDLSGARAACGDPESCEQNLGDAQANADAKDYAGQGKGRAAAQAAAVAEGQLESAFANPYQYAGLDYDYTYRKLVGDARSAGWEVNIAKNGRGVEIVRPDTGGRDVLRIMAPSPGAPPGDPPAQYRIWSSRFRDHIYLTP